MRYFFETPGVPALLDELTFDLLLAYRGALAMRAASPERPGAAPRAAAPGPLRLAQAMTTVHLDGEVGADAAEADQRDKAPVAPRPLAPATVNIRLTALRQFLVHCSMVGSLPHLSPDRIRAALRRLTIERRRPYQVLAESEWAGFLEAALLPASLAPQPVAEPTAVPAQSEPFEAESGPWGRTRAERLEAASQTASDDSGPDGPGDEPTKRPALVKSRAGLTGVRTAQRDHALLSLALATGLRAIELSLLDVGDLVREWHGGQEEWWLVLPDEKTKGQRGGRTLPLAPQLVGTLLAYIHSTGRKWEDPAARKTPLFVHRIPVAAKKAGASTSDVLANCIRRLSIRHIERIVDRVEAQWAAARDGSVLAAGETRAISPHSLRHSTAIALLEGNGHSGRTPASVEHVRGWLGHYDIRTTQGYLAHLDARRNMRPLAIVPQSAPPPGAPSSPDATEPPNGS